MSAQRSAPQHLRMPNLSNILLALKFSVSASFLFFFYTGKRHYALCLIVNNSIHFRAGFASRRHQRCIACLLSGKETIPIVLHKGIMK